MYSEETELTIGEAQKLMDSPEWKNEIDWEWKGETTSGDVFWNHVTGEIISSDINNQKYFIRRKL